MTMITVVWPTAAIVLCAWVVVRSGQLRSAFRRDVEAALKQGRPRDEIVTEADLAPLPAPIQTYLRRVGALNRPRVRNFHAEFVAEMRNGPDSPWMAARADQFEFFSPTARFFFMRASRRGLPFVVFHRYVGDSATMDVRVAGLVPVVRLSGVEMTKSETVTLLNDMCVLAPAALLDARITWTAVSQREVRGTYVNAGHSISAVLVFDAEGDLVDFRSEDRSMAEGRSMRRLPWTTPLSDYRDFGVARLPAVGEARWTDDGRTWAYGRFVLQRIRYNVEENSGLTEFARQKSGNLRQ